ncbi:MAG: hypothetical protein IT353_21200 [Gemmatimonadaceae bacterium]|nr:hypothetical protein [Gemmatimonadaceae bacterium]
MRRGPSLCLLLGLTLVARPLLAQQDTTPSLKVSPAWQPDRYRDADELIEMTLERTLGAGESLAVVIGALDVTHMTDVLGTRVRYRPAGHALPSGDSEISVYLVRDGKWTNIAKLPIKVRNRLGLDEGRALPVIDLSSAGQLKEGGTAGVTSARATYQDVTLRSGVQSTLARDAWRMAFDMNTLGVSQEEQRLQYNTLQDKAPALDLSDYKLELTRGASRVQVGNINTSDQKQLLDGFNARGVGGSLQLGSRTSLHANVLSGSNEVGWSHALGVDRAAHRLTSARLAFELNPSRPGALHLDVTGLDGAIQPIANFNQGSVTDAEESSGWGSQLSYSSASERVRFSGGLARSRVTNPADRLLSGDSATVAVRPTTRTARFGEVTVQLLKEHQLTDSTKLDVTAVLRHERVDPLYRSLGASTQADLQANTGEVNATVGPLALAGRLARSGDNLAHIASILTTKTNQSSLTAAVPLSSIVGPKGAWYLPQLSLAREGTHQFGDGIPTNGEFTAADVPDQASVNQTASLDWTRNSATLGYRLNRSTQDNQQPGRETADITGTVHAVSLGYAPSEKLNVTLETSRESQHFTETDARQQLSRVAAIARFKLGVLTEFSSNVSRSSSKDPAAGVTTNNTELQLEATRAFTLYRMIDGQPQGRVFVRFARVLASATPQFAGAILSRDLRWTINAGGSVRFY